MIGDASPARGNLDPPFKCHGSTFGNWRAKMSKTTKFVLASLLLGSTLLLPVGGIAKPNIVHRGLRGMLPMRFGEQRAERDTFRLRKPAVNPAAHRPTPHSAHYTIVDHPNGDPAYRTRVFGINEAGVVSGQYVDTDDGTFHAFLRMPDGSYPANLDIHIGNNDTFALLLNDKNEVFGSYIDNDAGLEQPWVRTKNGAVIPFQVPDGTGGAIGQYINNKGVLAGDYFDDNGAFHCFTRTRKGVITELPDAKNAGTGAGQGSQCVGINEEGDLSGGIIDSNDNATAFIRHDGNYEEFQAPGAGMGPGQGTTAAEIDDHGWVVGQVIDANGVMHGFIRDPSPSHIFTIVNAPDAGTSPGQGTVAVEHREAGWAIGEYIDSSGVSHGYYMKKNGKIVEFDPPGVGDAGTYFVISSNKAHQIVGAFRDENAVRHGFIRKP